VGTNCVGQEGADSGPSGYLYRPASCVLSRSAQSAATVGVMSDVKAVNLAAEVVQRFAGSRRIGTDVCVGEEGAMMGSSSTTHQQRLQPATRHHY